jgi:hypothetical protein
MSEERYTDPALAKRIIEYFKPSGWMLDPCRGAGAFYDHLPGNRNFWGDQKWWCEIREGRDFLDWQTRVDWILTNPPWGMEGYSEIAQHAFELATNVVFLVRLTLAIGTMARHRDFREQGHGLKLIIVLPWEDAGFPSEGFVLSVCHWQRNWFGPTSWKYW